MSILDASRRPSRSARLQLIDLHFEVRDASAELLSTPSGTARVCLQRAIHRFLAAERLFASMDEAVISGADFEAQRADLLAGLERLDAARTVDELYDAAADLRHSFLRLCEPLWRAKDRTDPA